MEILNRALQKLSDVAEQARIRGLDTVALELDEACRLIRHAAENLDKCLICLKPHGPACRCDWSSQ